MRRPHTSHHAASMRRLVKPVSNPEARNVKKSRGPVHYSHVQRTPLQHRAYGHMAAPGHFDAFASTGEGYIKDGIQQEETEC